MWTDEKVKILRDLWGKGKTASQIAEIIGGISRNAVIGKAHRLNLSAKIKNKSLGENISKNLEHKSPDIKLHKTKVFKIKIQVFNNEKETENPKQLEELDEISCKWPIGHPNESSFYFCGRKSLKDFSYCKLHLLYAFSQKVKKMN